MTAPLLLTDEDHRPLPDGSTWAEWASALLPTLALRADLSVRPRLVLLAPEPARLDPPPGRSGWVDPSGEPLARSADPGAPAVLDLPRLPTDPQAQLALIRHLMARKLDYWESLGVIVWDPRRVWVGPSAAAAAGVRLGPDVVLLGSTELGPGVVVEERCSLRSARVGPGARIKAGSVLEGAVVGADAVVGPMAHLRPGTVLEEGTKVGNFVEVKSSRLGAGAKASHLSYLGDAEIGAGANVGAGTITCNYDGFAKHRTRVGPGAFIGSNTALVAPVAVGAGAVIGAGSVIVQDVPADAVAIARGQQTTRPGAAARLRERLRARAPKKEPS